MKTAAEWLNEIGETVMFSAFAGGNPPGKEVEELVKHIQDDAIQSACKPLVEAITGLLKSADCHWYESNAGHDWRFAIDVAMVELRAHRLSHGPEEKA